MPPTQLGEDAAAVATALPSIVKWMGGIVGAILSALSLLYIRMGLRNNADIRVLILNAEDAKEFRTVTTEKLDRIENFIAELRLAEAKRQGAESERDKQRSGSHGIVSGL